MNKKLHVEYDIKTLGGLHQLNSSKREFQVIFPYWQIKGVIYDDCQEEQVGRNNLYVEVGNLYCIFNNFFIFRSKSNLRCLNVAYYRRRTPCS